MGIPWAHCGYWQRDMGPTLAFSILNMKSFWSTRIYIACYENKKTEAPWWLLGLNLSSLRNESVLSEEEKKKKKTTPKVENMPHFILSMQLEILLYRIFYFQMMNPKRMQFSPYLKISPIPIFSCKKKLKTSIRKLRETSDPFQGQRTNCWCVGGDF